MFRYRKAVNTVYNKKLIFFEKNKCDRGRSIRNKEKLIRVEPCLNPSKMK